VEQAYAGRIRIVKINSDENPQLAQAFGVRSIPTVVAMVNGQPADAFMGAKPEGEVRAFVERLLPKAHEQALQQAEQAWQAGDTERAEALLQQSLALDPGYDEARIAYVQLLVDAGRLDDAHAQFERISHRSRVDPELKPAIDALELAISAREHVAELPEEAELVARIAANPDDLQARLNLAELRIARKAWGPAMDELLEIVQRDRSFQDDIGRKTLISVFNMASAQPELVSQYRRRLSAMLF
jgi:putative thioredoxin